MTRELTALLADDEAHLARYLQDQLAAAWPELRIVANAANGIEAAQCIDALQPAVAFLDIRMPGLSGLEVAQGIEGSTLVVFVTAYDEHAVQAFEDGAVDYLVKPITQERVAKCVARLKARLQASALPSAPPDLAAALRQLLGPQAAAGALKPPLRYVRAHERAAQGEQVLQIDVAEVLYFDAADKYTCAVLPGGEKLLRTAITELESQLDPAQFQRIHRSTLVNLAHVHSTYRDDSGRMFVRIKDHRRELPVSRAYHEVFARM
jgi:DNA-binding LytR/AlgR family response regulator